MKSFAVVLEETCNSFWYLILDWNKIPFCVGRYQIVAYNCYLLGFIPGCIVLSLSDLEQHGHLTTFLWLKAFK
jgi:hypothetical protein